MDVTAEHGGGEGDRGAPRGRDLLAVVGGFAAWYVLLFSPVLFGGKLLAPGDGAAYAIPAFYGPRTAWTPQLFSGYPVGADPEGMRWYPPAIVFALLGHWWNGLVLFGYVLASCGAYWLVKDLTRSRLGGLVAGLTYGMSGFLISHLGHANMVQSAAWLPVIILALRKLKGGYDARWLVAAAAAIAMSFLAGHPQIWIYSMGLAAGYVLLTGWNAAAGWWRYWVLSVAAVAGGGVLTAVAVVPGIELERHSVRVRMTFDFFNEFSVPVGQLVTLVFPAAYGNNATEPAGGWYLPYFGAPNHTELVGYVGLLPLALAAIGAANWRRVREAWFWAVVAGACLVLVAGPATPLAWVLYHTPGYHNFRAPSRHFLEFSLAVAVLAGAGASAMEQMTPSRRAKWGAAAAIAMMIGIGLAWLALTRANVAAAAAAKGLAWSAVPWRNAAVGVPLVVAMAGALAMLFWSRSVRGAAVLAAVVAVDLGVFGWSREWRASAPDRRAAVECPAGLRAYRDELAGSHRRLATYAGGTAAAEQGVPNLSMLWGLSNVSGYNALILGRYAELLSMSPSGELDAKVLASSNCALDILSAKYLMMPKERLGERRQVMKDGVAWAAEDLGIELLQKCGEGPPAEMTFDLPAGVRATEVDLVTMLGDGVKVPQGTPVLEVVTEDPAGGRTSGQVRAGSETSEWAWELFSPRRGVAHERAPVFASYEVHDLQGSFAGHWYLGAVPLGGEREVRRLRIRYAAPCGVRVYVHKITLKDAAGGRSYPINPLLDALANQDRWRKVDELQKTIVYENRRALPRAWLVPTAVPVTAEAAKQAVSAGRLPDGRAFDPAAVAVVEGAPAVESGPSLRFTGKAEIAGEGADWVEVTTSASQEALVVLADVAYPGWGAAVDGRPAAVLTTDYLLRGVAVPAGEHRVRLEFRPTHFAAGAAVSGIAAAALGGLLALAALRRARPPE